MKSFAGFGNDRRKRNLIQFSNVEFASQNVVTQN